MALQDAQTSGLAAVTSTILTLGVANRYKWLTRLLTCYITSYRRPQTLLLITA